MNKFNLYIFCILATMLFSCSEDFEDFENKAYIESETKKTTFLIKPDVLAYPATLSVGIAKPALENIEFTFSADPSLVSVYNNLFNENAVVLPSEHYVFSETKATIATNSVHSTKVNIEFVDVNNLDRNIVYVLPVTIANADKIELLESARTHYYIFKGGAIINWAADIEDNSFPITWGNSSLVSGMNEITVEGMLYLRQASRDGSDSNIMTFFGVENVFLIRLGDTFDPGQIMVVAKSSGGKFPANANDRTSAPVGRWFHFAVTLDSSNSLKIYIDGVLQSTSTTGSGTFSIVSNCFIGKSYNDNRWWPGMICETRVWNKARTQDEIAASIYSVPATSEGLVAYWKFDEGNGNTIVDHTGNNSTITAKSALKWSSISLPE